MITKDKRMEGVNDFLAGNLIMIRNSLILVHTFSCFLHIRACI